MRAGRSTVIKDTAMLRSAKRGRGCEVAWNQSIEEEGGGSNVEKQGQERGGRRVGEAG